MCPRLILAFGQDAVSIENALYEDGRVLSCAAVAVPHARLGELPVAFVVLKPSVQITEVELLDFIQGSIPRGIFYAYIERICRLAAFTVQSCLSFRLILRLSMPLENFEDIP